MNRFLSATSALLLAAAVVQAETFVHDVPYFLSASHPAGEGFVRIFNSSEEAANLTVRSFDESGNPGGEVTLQLSSGHATHFNSRDLEGGNEGKGLTGSAGIGDGDWRLEIEADQYGIVVSSFVRTDDGFLSSMGNRTVIQTDPAYPGLILHYAPIVNPAGNRNQVSKLRVTNHENERLQVAFFALDDQGNEGTCDLYLEPGVTNSYDIAQLEEGSICSGETQGFGDGTGKWNVFVGVGDAKRITVINVMESPTGHLSNLSDTNVAFRDVTPASSGDDDHPNVPPGTTVLVPSVTSGYLGTADKDYFRFAVADTVSLAIYTTGPVDTEGTLTASDDSLTISNDDFGDDENFRIEGNFFAGDYDILVAGWSDEDIGAYSLHVDVK